MGNKNLIVLFFYVLMILKVQVIYICTLYVIDFFQMGFKFGEGLGKYGQGIIIFVEVVKRKGKVVVGVYGIERLERLLVDFSVYDFDEEDDKKFKEEFFQWKKKLEVSIIKSIVYS